MAAAVSPPTPADRLTGDVFGQVGYWTAGRLQHDAVLTHPFKRLHNRRFKHPSATPALVRPLSRTGYRADGSRRSLCGVGGPETLHKRGTSNAGSEAVRPVSIGRRYANDVLLDEPATKLARENVAVTPGERRN